MQANVPLLPRNAVFSVKTYVTSGDRSFLPLQCMNNRWVWCSVSVNGEREPMHLVANRVWPGCEASRTG